MDEQPPSSHATQPRHFSPSLTYHKPTGPRLCHRDPSGAPQGRGIPGCQQNLGQTARHPPPAGSPHPHTAHQQCLVPGRAESPGTCRPSGTGTLPPETSVTPESRANCGFLPVAPAKPQDGAEGWSALTCTSSKWRRLSSSRVCPCCRLVQLTRTSW